MGYFKKINALLVYSKSFHETVHNKWCLHKTIRQTENGLEHGFVKHWLNPATAVNISRVTVDCFPFDVIFFAMLPAHGIWRLAVNSFIVGCHVAMNKPMNERAATGKTLPI